MKLLKVYMKNFLLLEDNILTYQILRTSISQMINDIIENSLNRINEFNIKIILMILNHMNSFLISMSEKIKNECLEIHKFFIL